MDCQFLQLKIRNWNWIGLNLRMRMTSMRLKFNFRFRLLKNLDSQFVRTSCPQPTTTMSHSASNLTNSSQGRLIAVGAASTALLATSYYLASNAFKTHSHVNFSSTPKSASLSSQLATRSPQAFTSLLAAFGPDGDNVPLHCSAGAMIASPSGPAGKGRLDKKNENENYQFQWPRVSIRFDKEYSFQGILRFETYKILSP